MSGIKGGLLIHWKKLQNILNKLLHSSFSCSTYILKSESCSFCATFDQTWQAEWVWCFQALFLHSPIPLFFTATYIFNCKIWISVNVFLYLCFFLFPSTIIHHGVLTCLSVIHVPSSSSSMVRVFSSCVCRPFSRVVFPRLLIWSGLGPSMEGPSRMNVAEGEIWAPSTTPLAVTYTCHHNHQPRFLSWLGEFGKFCSAQEEKGRVQSFHNILIINVLYF
jgi:hypothetical protein